MNETLFFIYTGKSIIKIKVDENQYVAHADPLKNQSNGGSWTTLLLFIGAHINQTIIIQYFFLIFVY